MSKYNIKFWCGTMVESVPMLHGYFDERGHNHDPERCELVELRKLRDVIVHKRRIWTEKCWFCGERIPGRD